MGSLPELVAALNAEKNPAAAQAPAGLLLDLVVVFKRVSMEALGGGYSANTFWNLEGCIA